MGMLNENSPNQFTSLMANQVSLVLNLCCLVLLLSISIQADSNENRKVYVVYMGQKTQDDVSTSSLHLSMLQQAAGREIYGSKKQDQFVAWISLHYGRDGGKYMLQRYTKSFHGFSARLTQDEAQKISAMEGVVSVFPSKKSKLATTSSWDFIGFPLTVNRSTTESDIIIGVLDSGIWPESASFSDQGYGPPPAKWKGICEANFPCNNKIIGAQYFKGDGAYDPKDLQSPRDSNGHGTHTASTAAGNIVRNANLLGLHSGTARGGVPRARIAVYKVCWTKGCSDDDILSAFDTAIADGVDIISASIGIHHAVAYFEDSLAIGSFHAMIKGILTVQAAGNEGPNPQTISSIAPWVLSVAAGTKNPDLITPVKLGNNMVVDGVSINPFTRDEMYPLVYAGDVPNTVAGFSGSISRFCSSDNSLDKNLVQGKIILCDQLTSGEVQMFAGAVGSIMSSGEPYLEGSGSYPFPVSAVSIDQANNILQYIRSTGNATGAIMKSEDVNDPSSPYVASFSSRGPNPICTNILKPDLTAPGVRILAAWPPISPISDVEEDHRAVPFNMISGSSMACPHVSGIAAYIKSFNPTWSPATIKSAIMTTASPMSSQINTDAEFAYGVGYLNPVKAMRPGLVYDADYVDYVTFLCQQNYKTDSIKKIFGVSIRSCSELMNQTKDLNYPTFVIPVLRNEAIDVNFTRTVTNVGSAKPTYRALITQPRVSGLKIKVEPSVLRFKEYGQKLSFKVFVQATIKKLDNPIVSGGLTWDDGVHQVRSPIVVHVP